MKKVVLKLDYSDEKIKQKAMQRVSGLSGLESISLDQKDKKLTVTGDIDPVDVVEKLRKLCRAEIVSVGPAKEAEKKKEETKNEEHKKEGPKKDEKKREAELPPWMKAPQAYNQQPYFYQNQQLPPPYQPPPAPAPAPTYYQRRVVEDDPSGCVIT